MNNTWNQEEKILKPAKGMGMLLLIIFFMLVNTLICILSSMTFDGSATAFSVTVFTISIWFYIFLSILFGGLKIVNPNEALVLTLFGSYYGTIKTPGFWFVNPFVSAVNGIGKNVGADYSLGADHSVRVSTGNVGRRLNTASKKAVSLKVVTLNNDKQKINDAVGNPINIGVIVIWKVTNPTKAVFSVDDYSEYISIQTDGVLRNVVRKYPYDAEEEAISLRGDSEQIAREICEELQKKAEFAGVEIIEARVSNLSYAPEIAAAMLQKQQADAVIAARQKIVDGAVGMVEMALNRLSENNVVTLDDERKAQMISNLLVVLCANKETQPIVNSGSIY